MLDRLQVKDRAVAMQTILCARCGTEGTCEAGTTPNCASCRPRRITGYHRTRPPLVTCTLCGNEYAPRPDGPQSYCKPCSDDRREFREFVRNACKRAATAAQRVVLEQQTQGECKNCGEPISGAKRPESVFCSASCRRTMWSREWYRGNPDEARAKGVSDQARRRASARGAFAESVDRRVIFDRDGGRCHICGRKADAQDFHLDHLIPVSAGGETSHRNLRVAHPACNKSRGAGRLPAQLLMFG